MFQNLEKHSIYLKHRGREWLRDSPTGLWVSRIAYQVHSHRGDASANPHHRPTDAFVRSIAHVRDPQRRHTAQEHVGTPRPSWHAPSSGARRPRTFVPPCAMPLPGGSGNVSAVATHSPRIPGLVEARARRLHGRVFTAGSVPDESPVESARCSQKFSSGYPPSSDRAYASGEVPVAPEQYPDQGWLFPSRSATSCTSCAFSVYSAAYRGRQAHGVASMS